MKLVFKRPESLKDVPTHFCPGCGHGIVHRLVAEAIDNIKKREETIGVASVGCSVFLYDYMNMDVCEAPHGRAPAVATGVKRAAPDKIVYTLQGDGDLAAIGTSEIIHCANRGEMITVIFVNNTVFGMTGGQMAPTTMLGQQTTTTPYGRQFSTAGYPMRMAELLSTLEGAAYVARVAVHNAKSITRARKSIFKAFEMQQKGMGFTFVEVLSSCPTNWKMSPEKANERLESELIPFFPLGVFKERQVADFE